MREIKFRGKSSNDGEWNYGDLEHYNEDIFIGVHETDFGVCAYSEKAIPETVGQFTGLLDKNGKEIYEGDKVHCWGGEYYQGYWEFNDFAVVRDIRDLGIVGMTEYAEIYGNIHDNPELLK